MDLVAACLVAAQNAFCQWDTLALRVPLPVARAKLGKAPGTAYNHSWRCGQLGWPFIAYLGLGSNLGDSTGNLKKALELLEESGAGRVVAVSSLYLTAPVGPVEQPHFVNAAAALRTDLEPDRLVHACLEVEAAMGRVRTTRWGPRVIDVDVLMIVTEGGKPITLCNDRVCVPHPRMVERAFVLVPLAEIAPQLVVGNGVTAAEAAGCLDAGDIRKLGDTDWFPLDG